MAVRMLFGCERCAARPDRDTQRTLERQLRDPRCGAYLDAQPGGWLIWTAGGLLGRKRYACPLHRDALIEQVRVQHAGMHGGAGQVEPFPALWPDGFSALDEVELAELLSGDAGYCAQSPASELGPATTPAALPQRAPKPG